MKSHFELKIEEAMTRAGRDALAVPLGDSHRHAFVKGTYDGLSLALSLFRQSERQSVDEDDV